VKAKIIAVLASLPEIKIKNTMQPVERKDILHIFIDGIPY